MGQRFAIASDTREWLLTKFARGKANYWFTFVADFSAAMFFLVWEIVSRGIRPAWAGVAFFAGIMAWGLTEYIFHRWVYHQPDGIFGEGHNIHHTEAQELIAMPWFMTTLTMFALWAFCARILNIPYFSSILSGWLAGFVWYSIVHHSHHHWILRNGWIRRLKAYHRVHHQFPGYNFGVTIRYWDVVFGTVYRKPGQAVQGLSGIRQTAKVAHPETAQEAVLADA